MNRAQIVGAIALAGAAGVATILWTFTPSGEAGSAQQPGRAADGASAVVGSPRGGQRSPGVRSGADVPDPLDGKDLAAASRQALESAERGVETHDLVSLRKLKAKLDARREDTLLPPKDEEALDLAIACLAEEPNVQQRVGEFFEEEPASALHIQVRRVCSGE